MNIDIKGDGNIAAGGDVHVAVEQIRATTDYEAARDILNEYKENIGKRLLSLDTYKSMFNMVAFFSFFAAISLSIHLETAWCMLPGVIMLGYCKTKTGKASSKIADVNVWVRRLSEVEEELEKKALLDGILSASNSANTSL